MMGPDMNTSSRWIYVLVLALSLISSPAESHAQSGGDAGTETSTDAGSGWSSNTGDEPPAGAASEAKRVVRIRQVVELDKQRLRWLRSELGARTKWFEDLATGMAEIAQERNAKREKLEALEADPESNQDQLAALSAEVDELQEDYTLYDTQTDLALKAEKTVREQIDAMEVKIAQDANVLGKLTGEIAIELPERPEASAAAPAASTDGATPTSVSVPMPAPVSAPAASTAPKDSKVSSSMTSAQLQAERALERKEREVEIAKLAPLGFRRTEASAPTADRVRAGACTQ